ncbi:winged helix-turn-helix domain-containing protein [Alkalimonas mucilaginosa]|uniref:Winged helix-turn-helix domain-containing protein n=1 Tax=Alkalimonas mucilaginosa TaxID=3057676 RepID=A0ABU7JIE4_9GAMM|nr:winged helix-turn-helix domain-containing protein [Alkalimonas sp. MEB004]MEE2025425.1 winged helix-turn-helix domain-containing protein [Alkalimonas sp. MEB004]
MLTDLQPLVPIQPMSSCFYLGAILVDQASLTLSDGKAEPVCMQLKPIEVLAFLAQQYPRLVSRQELIDSVWAGNNYVGEKALTNAIWQLRHQLQQMGLPDCIVTVRKKGYRLDIAPHFTAAASNMNGQPQSRPAVQVQSGPEASWWRWWPLGAGVLLASLLWWQWPFSGNSEAGKPAPAWQLDAITRGDGRAMYPALSRDGRLLAFSWQKIDQAANLYLVELSRANDFKQLTFGENRDGAMVWSPDNRYLYYSSRRPVDGVCAIKRLDVVTLNQEPLASCSRHSRVYLDVSPDGRYLVFSGPYTDEGNSLYQLDLLNPEARVEPIACQNHCDARVRDLAFSPDGQQLLLTRRLHRLSEELFVRNLTTGDERQLTFGEEDIIGISWHPAGDKVLYAALHHGQRQGFVLDLASGTTTNLGLEDFGGQSRISASGEVFFHSMSSAPQLAYLPINPRLVSALFPLTVSDNRFENPHYNSKRGALVYISNESGYSEVWMADASMQNRRQLTFLQSRVKYPRWSHSGDQVAFVARFPGEDHDTLTLLEVATGKLTSLNTGLRWHVRPSWWYDDSAVIFSSNRNLYRFDRHDQSVQQLTFQGGLLAQMWDAERLLFTKGRNLGLWQLSADGEELQLLSGEDFTSSYAWTADSSGLYFLQQSTEQLVLRYLDWHSGILTDRIQLSPEQISENNTFSYAADVQRLYLEIDQQPRVDIMRLRHGLLTAAE